ncbi:hypothetical protein [Burkholderia orbicola]
MRFARKAFRRRLGKLLAAMVRFLLKSLGPRNGCALPDDIPDKEDSP